jgi:hypothetical protein
MLQRKLESNTMKNRPVREQNENFYQISTLNVTIASYVKSPTSRTIFLILLIVTLFFTLFFS